MYLFKPTGQFKDQLLARQALKPPLVRSLRFLHRDLLRLAPHFPVRKI